MSNAFLGIRVFSGKIVAVSDSVLDVPIVQPAEWHTETNLTMFLVGFVGTVIVAVLCWAILVEFNLKHGSHHEGTGLGNFF